MLHRENFIFNVEPHAAATTAELQIDLEGQVSGMQLPVPHLKQAERVGGAQSGDNTAVNVEGALQVLIQLPEQLSVSSPAEDRQPRHS